MKPTPARMQSKKWHLITSVAFLQLKQVVLDPILITMETSVEEQRLINERAVVSLTNKNGNNLPHGK